MSGSVPTTACEWAAERDVVKLCKAYRGRFWFPRLQLFSIACCRPIRHLFDQRCEDAVSIAERFALGDASKRKLQWAFQDATKAVRQAVTVVGDTWHHDKPLTESVAQAALACTHSTECGAIAVTGHVQDALVQLQAQKDRSLKLSNEQSFNKYTQLRQAINNDQVKLLLEMAGNPFRKQPD